MRITSLLSLLAVAFVICLMVVGGAASGSPENSDSDRGAAQLYGKYCSSCHGKDGRAKTAKGKFNHARDLTDSKWQDDVSDERIFNSIMNGRKLRGNMPAFGKKINEQEAESLVTYVRGLRK
jgi:mono/diheme cytochrome c family protein